MVTVEIRFVDGQVNVRRFGNGQLNRWTVLRPGDVDGLTGWESEELRELGEGVWGFPDAPTEIANLNAAMV
jgi:hypothetical protein